MRNRNPEADRIYYYDLPQFKYCQMGFREFARNHGLTELELREFNKNGMLISEFDMRFGKDAQAQKLIEWVRNGRK